ncbi:MAG: TIM barrel protein [Alphaproteobacteria bacterium]|jgi:sugar phosphate isomerase/epimerase
MTLPRLALAVIGDEIGPTLDEMISFCAENDVRRLDMRTVGGRNLMGMPLDEVATIARTIEKAGLSIPTFVSPVLKWAMPGKEAAGGKVDFAFDPATCPSDDPLAHAFDVAIVLKARKMRVFTHLRYPGYRPIDLFSRFERLADLALTYSVDVEVENEPVCNVGSVAELAQFFAEYPEPRSGAVKPLVDIGNGWSIGAPPSDADIEQLAPYVDAIHLKDRDMTAKRTVPLGDGDIPWADELRRLLRGVKAPEVLASIETHCPGDGRNATARSVAALRRLAGEIGAEIV